HMSAAAHQSATNTRCEVAATLVRIPTAPRLAVFGELCLEDLLVLAAVHEVAHIAPKILGEREAGRGRNKLFVWVLAQIPRRKPAGREFAFAVARRDQEHQPVDFVASNTLELLADLVMDRACLVARVRVLSEAYQTCCCDAIEQRVEAGDRAPRIEGRRCEISTCWRADFSDGAVYQ